MAPTATMGGDGEKRSNIKTIKRKGESLESEKRNQFSISSVCGLMFFLTCRQLVLHHLMDGFFLFIFRQEVLLSN
jgi:hypothetical protein